MKQKKWHIIVLIIFLVFLFFIPKRIDQTHIKEVYIAQQNIKVELALTSDEQELGLSGRQSLGIGEGMLFIFSRPSKYSFWMKDMNFPIDMIWIGEDMSVVYIKENVLPSSYPDTYGPDDNAKYVLEVNAGFSKKNNLKVGDKSVFTY